MTSIQLYDLTGAEDERRFSPFCWRSKLALAHKGLAFDTIIWHFTDQEALSFSGQSRVPVMVHDGETVFDSWTIACFLEDRYGDRAPLFGSAQARATTRFINQWTDKVLHGALAPLVLIDIYAHVHAQDREYFRNSREKVFGKPLAEVSADRDSRVQSFRQTLEPLRATLQVQPYLAGDAPAYADYIVFGAFLWARSVSPFKLLADDDAVANWRERMLDAGSDIARQAPGYAF